MVGYQSFMLLISNGASAGRYTCPLYLGMRIYEGGCTDAYTYTRTYTHASICLCECEHWHIQVQCTDARCTCGNICEYTYGIQITQHMRALLKHITQVCVWTHAHLHTHTNMRLCSCDMHLRTYNHVNTHTHAHAQTHAYAYNVYILPPYKLRSTTARGWTNPTLQMLWAWCPTLASAH